MRTSPKQPPYGLIILDGFGYSPETKGNAIAAAHTPHFDYLWKNYPHALLNSSGESVGLPPGYAGNSEVGHITIGAGRVIKQDFTRINEAIADGSFYANEVLQKNLKELGIDDGRLHLVGLLSDAAVHAHTNHLFALIDCAQKAGIKEIYIHAFLDGRDSPPRSAETFLKKLDTFCATKKGVALASIAGRFYAMDRDKNWNRTAAAYQALTSTNNTHTETKNWAQIIQHAYLENISDEFIPPTQLISAGGIKSGDGVIFFNFRPDRARQFTAAFTQQNFSEFTYKPLNLAFFLTMTDYHIPHSTAHPLFTQEPIDNTLLEILSRAGKKVFCIAETEKYAHVTYFFNGKKEATLPHQERVLVPSLKERQYTKHPEMSARTITQKITTSLRHNQFDFYLINYANADMVGHSGDFQATVKAIECLDAQIGVLYKAFVTERNGTLIITADHGKAECMVDLNNSTPHTAHTMSPVPFIIANTSLWHQYEMTQELTQLSDIAPFIRKQIGL